MTVFLLAAAVFAVLLVLGALAYPVAKVMEARAERRFRESPEGRRLDRALRDSETLARLAERSAVLAKRRADLFDKAQRNPTGAFGRMLQADYEVIDKQFQEAQKCYEEARRGTSFER